MRHLIEGTAAAVVILDEQLRHLYVNPAWVRVSGVPVEALSGRTLAEVLPDVRYPDDVMPQVLADGEPREVTITGTTHVASPPLGRRLWRAVYHRLELPGWGVCLAGIRLLHAGQRRTPAPVLTRPGAGTEVLWLPTGPPIGTGLGGYESITVPMERGATLLLYTDGLVERRGTDIDVSLRELADLSLPADGALDDLLDTLLSGMAHGAYEDDVAILAARQP